MAVFRREGDGPVSIDFGNGYMYVAGANTVDSFPAHHGYIGARDGSTVLQLVNGDVAPAGCTAQVGTLNRRSLLVTLKIFVDAAVAAPIVTGGAPLDIDAAGGVLAVLDRSAGMSHLSVFSYNAFGELTAESTPITIGVPNANGVAIVPARNGRER